MTLGGLRTANEIRAGGLHTHFEMYALAFCRAWFSLWFWRLRLPVQTEYEELAKQVESYLPEVELALREDKAGPHMRKIVYPNRSAFDEPGAGVRQ